MGEEEQEKLCRNLYSGCDIILGNEEDAEKVFGIKPERGDVPKGM